MTMLVARPPEAGARHPGLVPVPGMDLLAMRLAEEYPELSAGSVLRCVLRAAHGLRMAGVPSTRMSAETERITRSMLARRAGRS